MEWGPSATLSLEVCESPPPTPCEREDFEVLRPDLTTEEDKGPTKQSCSIVKVIMSFFILIVMNFMGMQWMFEPSVSWASNLHGDSDASVHLTEDSDPRVSMLLPEPPTGMWRTSFF